VSCAAAAHSRPLHSRRSQREDSDADEEEEEAAQLRRRAKRRAPRGGESVRVGERLTVTVLSGPAMPSASVPEAVAFARAKLITRHRRTRGVDPAHGIPYDFAHAAT
jgi:hypothetical protein